MQLDFCTFDVILYVNLNPSQQFVGSMPHLSCKFGPLSKAAIN